MRREGIYVRVEREDGGHSLRMLHTDHRGNPVVRYGREWHRVEKTGIRTYRLGGRA